MRGIIRDVESMLEADIVQCAAKQVNVELASAKKTRNYPELTLL